MNRLLLTGIMALGMLIPAATADAQSSKAMEQSYGQGVHAYFAGQLQEAMSSFSQAIQLGSRDPRVYFFRGLAQAGIGNAEAASVDFELGAQLEASSTGRHYAVGRSLERVQGPLRIEIEQARRAAKLVARQQAMSEAAPNVVAASRPIIPDPSTTGQETVQTNFPDVSGVANPGTPFDNPIDAEPLKPTQSRPVQETPPTAIDTGNSAESAAAAPTAGDNEAPMKDDPFGDTAGETTPPTDTDPFGEPKSDDPPMKEDPFGDSDAKNPPTEEDPFGDSDAKKPPTEEDPFGDSDAKKPPTEEDPFGDSDAKKPPTEEDPFGDSDAKKPPTEEDPFGDSDAKKPPTEEDPFGDSDAKKPPTEEDPFGDSDAKKPPTEEDAKKPPTEEDPFAEKGDQKGDESEPKEKDPFGDDEAEKKPPKEGDKGEGESPPDDPFGGDGN